MLFRVNNLVMVLGITVGYLLVFSPRTLLAGNETNSTYLALGDSVAFGLNPTLLGNQPPPSPSQFIGYPEVIGELGFLLNVTKEVNAACPGETSGSFINTSARDYGCHSPGPQGQPPYKAFFGLHTTYPGAQLDFAVSQLASNKQINLVTLGIGSNDALLLIADCSSSSDPMGCVNAGLPNVLRIYAANLTAILTAIRAQYGGDLVLVGYYSPATQLIPVAQAINSVMTMVGSGFHTIYADGFTAFQIAAIPFGGDVCKAGLLIRLDANTCDIHPSPRGRDLLAATVIVAAIGQ